VTRTLVVTNDFPTRQGGIETFVAALVDRLPPDDVVVYTATMPNAAAYDATLPYPVVRDRATTLLPTRRVGQRTAGLLREHRLDTVLFGASAPLGLLATGLRRAGARRLVGITHGHECWWARVPGTRQALRRIGDATDCLTYLGPYTRSVIAPALSPAARQRMQQLTPGVDPDVFVPATRPRTGAAAAVRAALDIAPDRPVVVCVGRLTPRKGQDTLIAALPAVLAAVPEALLLIVGTGSDRDRLERLAAEHGVAAHVRFAGSVPLPDLPAHVAAGDVFAMPCRTRRGGLEVEAFGIVFLEAQSCGLPVLVGASGGAPDTVRDGVTGFVVEPAAAAVAPRLIELLGDPERARTMGAAGRVWVTAERTWDQAGARLRDLLAS
jgi:phosphatidylinositol alpha-1,6-mannosyltransferase